MPSTHFDVGSCDETEPLEVRTPMGRLKYGNKSPSRSMSIQSYLSFTIGGELRFRFRYVLKSVFCAYEYYRRYLISDRRKEKVFLLPITMASVAYAAYVFAYSFLVLPIPEMQFSILADIARAVIAKFVSLRSPMKIGIIDASIID